MGRLEPIEKGSTSEVWVPERSLLFLLTIDRLNTRIGHHGDPGNSTSSPHSAIFQSYSMTTGGLVPELTCVGLGAGRGRRSFPASPNSFFAAPMQIGASSRSSKAFNADDLVM